MLDRRVGAVAHHGHLAVVTLAGASSNQVTQRLAGKRGVVRPIAERQIAGPWHDNRHVAETRGGDADRGRRLRDVLRRQRDAHGLHLAWIVGRDRPLECGSQQRGLPLAVAHVVLRFLRDAPGDLALLDGREVRLRRHGRSIVRPNCQGDCGACQQAGHELEGEDAGGEPSHLRLRRRLRLPARGRNVEWHRRSMEWSGTPLQVNCNRTANADRHRANCDHVDVPPIKSAENWRSSPYSDPRTQPSPGPRGTLYFKLGRPSMIPHRLNFSELIIKEKSWFCAAEKRQFGGSREVALCCRSRAPAGVRDRSQTALRSRCGGAKAGATSVMKRAISSFTWRAASSPR